MILTDKPYIEIPPDSTPLMHYLTLYQLLSILKFKHVVFSSVSSYKDASEATLTSPSYDEVSKYLLWEDNTPVQKDEEYANYKRLGTKLGDNPYWKHKEIRHLDTFEYLIYSFSRHFMFTHCWSISDTENILMWDRYKHQNCTAYGFLDHSLKEDCDIIQSHCAFQRIIIECKFNSYSVNPTSAYLTLTALLETARWEARGNGACLRT